MQISPKLCHGTHAPAIDVRLGNVFDPASTDKGVCPVCGQDLTLGYALLVPAHTPRLQPG